MQKEWLRRSVCVGIGLSLALAPITRAEALVIGTSSIANGAVTTPKIGNLAVTNAKIGNAAVTNAKIGTYAITHTKIANGNVINSKLAARAITPNKVAFYTRVIVVAPSGGDFTSPVDAMNFLANPANTGGAPSTANPYLVKIMPGIYNIGDATVQMVPHVDIEGSGIKATMITGTAHASLPGDTSGTMPLTGVVTGASNAEIRSLSVENVGAGDGNTYVAAILARNCEVYIKDVEAESGGSNRNAGIIVHQTAAVDDSSTIMNSGVWSGFGAHNVGVIVRNDFGGEPTLGPWVVNSGVSSDNDGYDIFGAMPVIIGGYGAGPAYAMFSSGAAPIVTGTSLFGDIKVSDSTAPAQIANCFGDLMGTTLTVDNAPLLLTGSHLGTLSASLLNSATLTLLNSSLGGTVTMGSGTFNASNSALGGPATVTGGTATCLSVTNTSDFTALPANCQVAP